VGFCPYIEVIGGASTRYITGDVAQQHGDVRVFRFRPRSDCQQPSLTPRSNLPNDRYYFIQLYMGNRESSERQIMMPI
jgi:hypothetical protein